MLFNRSSWVNYLIGCSLYSGTRSATCRGVKKSGGKIMLNAHVEEILVEDNKAVGVRLADNSVVRANTVVSNASSWDTLKLLPPSAVPAEYQKSTAEMPINRSFMHLHLGFDSAGPTLLQCGHVVLSYAADVAALSAVTRVCSPNLDRRGNIRSLAILVLPAGLPDDLIMHHIVVDRWEDGVDADQNVVRTVP